MLSGTTDELKQKASIEEKVTVEVNNLDVNELGKFKDLANVVDVIYEDGLLMVKYKEGKNNLINMINYLKTKEINYQKIYSERPTLNDVFLELTGKELRD